MATTLLLAEVSGIGSRLCAARIVVTEKDQSLRCIDYTTSIYRLSMVRSQWELHKLKSLWNIVKCFSVFLDDLTVLMCCFTRRSTVDLQRRKSNCQSLKTLLDLRYLKVGTTIGTFVGTCSIFAHLNVFGIRPVKEMLRKSRRIYI